MQQFSMAVPVFIVSPVFVGGFDWRWEVHVSEWVSTMVELRDSVSFGASWLEV